MNEDMGETFITKTFEITAKNGLHIRPAEQLARLANKFAAQIGLIYQDQRVDAKSIMDMLTLGASHGAQVTIEARGTDAPQAVEAILALVASKFVVPAASDGSGGNGTPADPSLSNQKRSRPV